MVVLVLTTKLVFVFSVLIACLEIMPSGCLSVHLLVFVCVYVCVCVGTSCSPGCRGPSLR